MAIPRPFCTPGSQDTTSAATPPSHGLVIIGPGAFITTTTFFPIAEYFRIRFTSVASNCNVERSWPSHAFLGTTATRMMSASSASGLLPSPNSSGQDSVGPPLKPAMPSLRLILFTPVQELPHPLPPPMERGSLPQAWLPTRATFAAFDKGSSPPSFFRTAVDSAMMRSASASLHLFMLLEAPQSGQSESTDSRGIARPWDGDTAGLCGDAGMEANRRPPFVANHPVFAPCSALSKVRPCTEYAQ
mmetsp:Transcript_116628/g.260542  ORF Transcript_116628/g.260542 Transcript_116628/m.260542 type:complete len:245 (+) Transcript_116628:651-1385(+)